MHACLRLSICHACNHACMYACMHVCIRAHTHTHTHTHMHTHTHTHAHTHICIHACIYVYIYIYIYIYKERERYIHIDMHTRNKGEGERARERERCMHSCIYACTHLGWLALIWSCYFLSLVARSLEPPSSPSPISTLMPLEDSTSSPFVLDPNILKTLQISQRIICRCGV